MDDLEFVQRCSRGDRQALKGFLEKYSRLIYNYIYQVLSSSKANSSLQSAASDIFQEFFYNLTKDNYKKLKSFKARNGSSLASWLRQVTVNFTIDYLRRQKSAVSLDAETDEGFSLKDSLEADILPASEEAVLNEKMAGLKDCIQQLDKDEKLFLELHFFRRVLLDDLQKVFKVTRGALDMRKLRLVERLRDCFKSKGFLLDL
jgi:RNA polymerase sigma factor (sigma-70 family)